MAHVLQELVSTILQLAVFTAIPFAAFVVRNRSARGFLASVGLVRTPSRALFLSLGLSALFALGGVGMAVFSHELRELMTAPQTVSGALRARGGSVTTVISLLLIAWFKTSLAEEILFRGFIGKGLMARLGFRAGNLMQAAIFSAVHVGLFAALTHASASLLMAIGTLSGAAGFAAGWVKQQLAAGSIIPGWFAHGLGNTLSYGAIVFVL